jgi:hypothetical protein
MVNHAKPEIIKQYWRGNTHHLSSMQTDGNTTVRKTMAIVFWNFLKLGEPVTTESRHGSFESLRQAIRRKRLGLLL